MQFFFWIGFLFTLTLSAINKMQICNTTLKMALMVCLITLVCAKTEKFPTALTVKEDAHDLNKENRAHGNQKAEDPEDLEIFYPTSEWQTLKPGQAVPAGSRVRLNLHTGQREARLAEEDSLKGWKNGRRQEIKKETSFTPQKLKEVLQKFKEGDEILSKKELEQDEGSVWSQFRSVDELKRDMDALDILVETDVQIMHKLVSQFNNTYSTVHQRVIALRDLEYLVHQVDNAQNLVSMGGMKLITNALNDTDIRLQENAAFVLGSAVSSNPSVQIAALEDGALQKLLTMLATPYPVSVKKKALFALACLLRHFPFAQNHFVKTGGLQVLAQLFQAQGADTLRVRIITILYDLITEKELILLANMDAMPQFPYQEYLRQYNEVSLKPILAEQGWCSLVPELLSSLEHDTREKALRTLLAMMPYCQTQYQQNPTLSTSLSILQKEYQKLVLTEETLGEDDEYFGDILALLDTLVVKMN